MDSFKSPDQREGEILRNGDEFAYSEFTSLAPIQFKGGALSAKKSERVETATPAIAASVATGVATDVATQDIEVIDDSRVQADIYAMPNADRIQLFLEVLQDRQLAINLSNAAIQFAIIRNNFRIHTNKELMARQLVLIGQCSDLFDSILVIPNIHLVSSETLLDRLRKSNRQQISHGQFIRVRKSKKQQVPTIGISQAATTSASKKPQQQSEVQFPQSILSRVSLSETSRALTMLIPPNTSVLIDGLHIESPGTIPLMRESQSEPLSIQAERPIYPIDPMEPLFARDFAVSDSQHFLPTFDFERMMLQHNLMARPESKVPRDPRDCDDFSSITAPTSETAADEKITVVSADSSSPSILEVSRLRGFSPSVDYSTNIVAHFMSLGMLDVLWQLTLAKASKQAQIVARTRDSLEAQKRELQSARVYREKVQKLEILTRLIEDNFESQRSKDKTKTEVGHVRASIARSDEDKLLSSLSEKERRFILAEFSRIWNASTATSSCEHFKLVSLLRTTTFTPQLSKYHAQLVKMLDANEVAKVIVHDRVHDRVRTLIRCSVCGQPAICPHRLALLDVQISRGTRAQEREALSQFIEKIPERNAFFCRVCGEHFEIALVASDDDTNKVSPEDPQLMDNIYHEMITILRYIRAQNATDQQAFARMIMHLIYPFIEAIENRTAIAQTSVATEYNAKIRIFIAIYIFAACIVNMKHFGIIFDGFTPRDESRIEAYAIKYAIDKIMSIESVSLVAVPSMNRDVIGTNIVASITHLRSLANASALPTETPSRDYRTALMYDPIFSIIFFHCNLERTVRERPSAKEKAKSTKSTKTSKTSKTKISKSRGGDDSDIAKLYPPNSADPFNYRRNILFLMPRKAENPRNVYEPLLSHCMHAEISDHIDRTTKPEIIMRSIISIVAKTMELREFDFSLDTPNRAVVEFRKKSAHFSSQLSKVEKWKRSQLAELRKVPLQFESRTLSKYETLTSRPIKLSAIYDANGIAHKWTILLFEPRIRANESHVHEIPLGSPDTFNDPSLVFAGKKCSVCGIKQADTDTIDEASLITTLDQRRDIENFYRFFETRCPEEGAHTFNDKLECTKCHYTAKKAASLNIEYYKTYASKMINSSASRDISAAARTARREVSKEEESLQQATRDYALQPWTFKYELVVSAADIFKVPRHNLQLLGAYEGLSRTEVADESFIARMPKLRTDAHIGVIRMNIFDIFSLFSILRSIAAHNKLHTSASINKFINELRLRIGGSSASFDAAIAALPTLDSILSSKASVDIYDFPPENASTIIADSLDIFALAHKPAEIIDHHLEVFCAILLALNANAKQCPTCAILAHIFLDRAISGEKTMLKAEHYNLSIVQGTKLASDESEIGSLSGAVSAIEEADDEEDIRATAEVDEDDDEEANPFSTDVFDLDDTRADDEIIDPEDTDTIMHIGNELGW